MFLLFVLLPFSLLAAAVAIKILAVHLQSLCANHAVLSLAKKTLATNLTCGPAACGWPTVACRTSGLVYSASAATQQAASTKLNVWLVGR